MVDSRGTPIYSIIAEAESVEKVVLTESAREMLAIPVMERFEAEPQVNWNAVMRSVRDIIAASKSDARSGETINGKLNSIAIIRGFFKRFCNIPPFCVNPETRR